MSEPYLCPCLRPCPRCGTDGADPDFPHPEDGLASCLRCDHEWWVHAGPIMDGSHIASPEQEREWSDYDSGLARGAAIDARPQAPNVVQARATDSDLPAGAVLTLPDGRRCEWVGRSWVGLGERCTGVTARWCPVHGSCACKTGDGWWQGDLDDPACPLHRPESLHAEGR